MKKLLLASALLLSLPSAKAQLALENFNSGTLPTGWVLISDGKTVSSSFTGSTAIRAALNAAAWTPWEIKAAGDFSMITTSLFTPAGTADRWLITPSFTVSSTNTFFKWSDYDLASAEKVQVWISTTAGTTKADFTTKLYDAVATAGDWGTKAISLGAYNGQTVRLAFVEANTNDWGFVVDDVEAVVLPSNEMGITSISPTQGSYQSYNTSGSTIPVSGFVKNNGASTITSYKVNYQAGTSPIVSETKTVSIPPFGTASFSIGTPITLTSANQVVKVWVELTGDALKTNDTLKTTVAGYTTKPNKKIMIEQKTGTWCQWCPRGHIYMDSIHKVYPNNVSLAAVHTSSGSWLDPMDVTAYSSFMGLYPGGYPTFVVDRRIGDNPSNVFTNYANEKDKFSVGDITVTPTLSGTNLTIKAEVTPTVNINADYRLVLVLTENRLTGAAGTYWDQMNAYSGGGAGPMGNAEFNFPALPSRVPGNIMKYDFVARGIYPSPTGTSGSLPASMTSGTKYTYTFPPVNIGTWNKDRLTAIVMLVNGADFTILNSNNQKVTNVSIKEATVGVNELDVYPNPANDIVTTHFNLEQSSNVAIEIVDMLGRVVKTVSNKSLTPGTYEVPTSVSELVAGIYLVKITTETGTITERISVVK